MLVRAKQIPFLLVGFAIVAGLCAPWLAQLIGGWLYPPLIEAAGPALRAVGPVRLDNPAAGEIVPVIEYTLYSLTFVALTVSFLYLVAGLRQAKANKAGADPVPASAPPTIATGSDDISLTLAVNRPRRDLDILTLEGKTVAMAIEKRQQARGNDTRTRALQILRTVALDGDGNPIESAPAPSPAGFAGKRVILNRYALDKPLASGGAGVVYKAFDQQLRRVVAMKQLFANLSQSSYAQRFIEEAHSLAALSHPNIVPIYDLILEDGYWFVMEFLSGGSLHDRIHDMGYVDHPDALRMAVAVAQGLAAAHKRGLVHRDIKPANILYNGDGDVKIGDFGIAKSEISTLKTTIGVVLGSPAYLSPEQAFGESISDRSDVYAFGVTLYQALTGELPFEGEAREVLIKHLNEKPEPPIDLNPDLPPALSDLVLTMLNKEPQERPDANSCLDNLLKIQSQL